MKTKSFLTFLLLIFLAANSSYGFSPFDEDGFFSDDYTESAERKEIHRDALNEAADYTGDVFFSAPSSGFKTNTSDEKKAEHTMPPLKKARIHVKNKIYDSAQKNREFAPTNPEEVYYRQDSETSDFASKEVKENFDEDMVPDGFEADEQAVLEKEKTKHFKSKKAESKELKNTENIILDCENMDYDTDKYCLYARGNVNVKFVEQDTIVKADTITYDRMNNTIKAEGNVSILKNGQTINGDYIFVDMNEENALIENPVSCTPTITMTAKKGYVYGNKIVQEDGNVIVDESFPIEFRGSKRGPSNDKIMYPKEQSLSADMEKGLVKVDARQIQITQKGDLETIRVRGVDVKKGKVTLLKLPALKVYTNKNHDYVETNSWEMGSFRDLGMYIGPGFVFELPKGSVLKAMPILNYKEKIGVGGIGRFNSGTNTTRVAYGTAVDKFVIRGKQALDDDLYLQYGVNDYLDEWFLGRRRPKYGVDLVYNKNYSSDNFLLKDRKSSFAHRLDVGFYHDIDYDRHYKALKGGNMSTARFRYMAQAAQSFWKYKNEEKLTALDLSLVSQLSAAVYGTGDTQFIGRIGPRLHTQIKRWSQDIGYFQSVYQDNTPLTVFDTYRYGKSYVYLREYFRICKYLNLCWFGSANLSDDSPGGRFMHENSFYISIGPEDFRLNLGYDTVRENTFFNFEVMMDAKGSNINYDKLEIKQVKKPKPEEKLVDKSLQNNFRNTEMAPVLQHATVENIKAVEDVL